MARLPRRRLPGLRGALRRPRVLGRGLLGRQGPPRRRDDPKPGIHPSDGTGLRRHVHGDPWLGSAHQHQLLHPGHAERWSTRSADLWRHPSRHCRNAHHDHDRPVDRDPPRGRLCRLHERDAGTLRTLRADHLGGDDRPSLDRCRPVHLRVTDSHPRVRQVRIGCRHGDQRDDAPHHHPRIRRRPAARAGQPQGSRLRPRGRTVAHGVARHAAHGAIGPDDRDHPGHGSRHR